ncbi:MAG: urea ABC transporter ATP-binding subunit UrtE [Deltaproteobacteria bacterium]|jgi:urea transport system ATP-binding protein|nr:urea ABC transporter ATP-binding subunit UrtE [Deltaproteobacteria bacterium]
MLRAEKLNQFYGESNILRDLTLEAKKGRNTCLMGRNGVGKTTFLGCVMGLVPVRTGKIFYKGRDITGLAPEARARMGMGYVPQGRQIFPLLTVEENLKLGLPYGRSGKKREIPTHVYDFFPVLREMLKRRGGDLSGGQQQQLAIARALATDPEFLILDEPTEGIQPNIVREIVLATRRFAAELDMTVLQVEQKVPVAKTAGDDYAIMERGSVAAKGEMKDLGAETIKNFLSV